MQKKNLIQATELYPNMVEVWINLSTVYNHEGDQEQEMNGYDRALELDSSRPQIWHNRGYLYRQKGMFKDAILDYQESLRLRPQHIQTLLYKDIA
ncbi:MAG: tetratricopeptide repeat protein, partial [Nitrososphaeraceae archaeon]|nr:tetratricopeptide repeat protein [Nitrososphaeraceae archaeon]